MKKLILVVLTLVVSSFLFGCNNIQKAQKEPIKSTLYTDNEQYKRKVIIMDSVDELLPPEAKNIQSMPSKSEPQPIPNVNLNDPLVITKMPYVNKKILEKCY